MISRVPTRASSLLQQEFLYPSVNGPHMLLQLLFWHRLSQEQVSARGVFISSLRTRIGESGGTQQGDGALKFFVRNLTYATETQHGDGVKLQVSSPWLWDGKEAHFRDGGVKLSQNEDVEVGLGNVLEAKSSLQSKSVKEESHAYSRVAFWKRVHSADKPAELEELDGAGKNEESTTEIAKEVKVISTGSKEFAEVHTILIRRRLTRKFLNHLQEKIDFLHSMAVPVTQVKILLRKRAFLSTSPEKLVTVVEVLTEHFESKHIAFKVLTANAGILERPLEMLKHKMHILSQFGVHRKTLVRLGTTQGMWTLRTQNYEEKLNFLKELGMNAQARSNVLYRCPVVLRISVSSLKATMDFFESTDIFGENLLRFLELRPAVFCSSVSNSLVGTLKLFQGWGLSVDDVIRALRQLPQYTVEHIESQYKLLRDHGLPHDDVASIIRRRPSFLANSHKDLKDKLDFLCKVNRDISEVRKYPMYLACSLEDRIIPRFKALEGVNLSKKPSLSAILSSKLSIFKRRFNIP